MTVDDHDRPVWKKSFSQAARDQQVQEDSDAWYGVTGLLLTIISFGLSLALFTVWMSYH